MIKNNLPIGVFDSGVGGLTILKAIQSLLPNEDYIYVSDNKYSPYGEKSKETILQRSDRISSFLIEEKKCKLIIVACNTATTNVIKELRERFSIPFIGVEPAIKPAIQSSKSGVVGLLATQETLSSYLLTETSAKYGKGTTLIKQIGRGLVEAIESGEIASEQTEKLLKKHLKPILKKEIDVLVLGCTHYPFLKLLLEKNLPKSVQVIDGREAVAKRTQAVLKNKKMLTTQQQKGKSVFYVTSTRKALLFFLEKDSEIISLEV